MWAKAGIGPATIEQIQESLDPQKAFQVFQSISDRPCPSQSSTYTRGKVVYEWWKRLGGGGSFELDYLGTGNQLIAFDENPCLVMVVHCDEISYLVGPETRGGQVTPLVPFCNHHSRLWWPARALRYHPPTRAMQTVALGEIRPVHPETDTPAFFGNQPLYPGDRVVYENPARHDGGDRIFGKVDNAFGVASLIMVLGCLSQLRATPPIWLLFTDEEEGPPGTPTAFSRGMRRLLNRHTFPPDTVFVEVDGHECDDGSLPGPYATFAEQAGRGKGTVTPPHVYAHLKDFAGHLSDHGVKIREHRGYVCRGDSAALIEFHRDTLLVGYEVQNTHYKLGRPTASRSALVHLSAFLTCLALGTLT